MRAGALRDRVTIQANTPAVDGYGDALPVWSDVATRWAAVTETAGTEDWQADQVRPGKKLTVSMRYYEGLTSAHRLLYGTRVLNVGSVINPDGMKIEHVLTCSEEGA